MVIAIQAQAIKPAKFSHLVKLKYWFIAPFQRIWWHTHAYSVIFGVMVLTVLSVIVLYLYDNFSKVFLVKRQEDFYSPSEQTEG